MHIELVALILPRHNGKHQPINHDSFLPGAFISPFCISSANNTFRRIH